jgi:hypothetical protein
MPDVLPGVTRQKTTNKIPVEFNRPGHPDHSRMGSPCTCTYILLATTVGYGPYSWPYGWNWYGPYYAVESSLGFNGATPKINPSTLSMITCWP